jgi:hypothetical protein
MKKDDINRIAVAAGFPESRAFSDLSDLYPRLERFAAIVAAAEREACAKVCENAIASIWEYSPEDVKQTGTNVCKNLAAAIRARGQS